MRKSLDEGLDKVALLRDRLFKFTEVPYKYLVVLITHKINATQVFYQAPSCNLHPQVVLSPPPSNL